MNIEGNTGNRSLDLCKRVVTTESFITEAKQRFGNKYDYSKTQYINREHRVIVTCPIHGDFEIFAREHLDGKICPTCEKSDKFLVKLKEKFGDKFGLENYIYKNSTTPVELTCPEHGPFKRLPNSLLSSPFGCPICGNKIAQTAHEEAEARKNAIREAKAAAIQIEKEKYFEDWTLRDKRCKKNLKEALDNYIPSGFGVSAQPYWAYVELIGSHINLIRYDSSFAREYVSQFLLSEREAKAIIQEVGVYNVYKYPGEAPSPIIREIFEKNNLDINITFEQSLARRDCEVLFRGNDLYIIWKLFQNPIGMAIEHSSPMRNSLDNLPKTFVSIDFETFYPQRVSACSVGMVKYIDGKKKDTFYSLIRPPFEYEGKKGFPLTNKHGFTRASFGNAETMVKILPKIEAFVGDMQLVAHNSSTERDCLLQTAAFYNLDLHLDVSNILDTFKIAKDYEIARGSYSTGEGVNTLDAICQRYGICSNNHHNALADAEMCGNLLLKFAGCECSMNDPTTKNEVFSETESITPTNYDSKRNWIIIAIFLPIIFFIFYLIAHI